MSLGSLWADESFPERNPKSPHYLNLSGLKGFDLSGKSETDRAVEATGIDLAVVFLPDIPADKTPEKYAADLFEKWRIGGNYNGKGVLILFIENRHALKIEVGYALEPVFPDGFIGSYQDAARQYFASEQFGDFVSTLVNQMAYRYQNRGNEAALQAMIKPGDERFLSGGAGIFRSDYYRGQVKKLPAIDPLILQHYQASEDLETVIGLYLESLEKGVDYPYLNLLSEGSRYMRLEYPHTPGFYQDLSRNYQKAMPYQLFILGDLAVARFKPVPTSSQFPLFPLFLRREPDGKWRVNVAQSWAYAEDSNEYRLSVKDHPWMFAFVDVSYEPSSCAIPPLVRLDRSLASQIHELEDEIKKNPDKASNYFRLADLFYWQCYWIKSAIEVVEKGLEKDPTNISAHWLAIKMRERYPLWDGIKGHYEAILKQDPKNAEALQAYSWYAKTVLKDEKKSEELLKQYQDTL